MEANKKWATRNKKWIQALEKQDAAVIDYYKKKDAELGLPVWDPNAPCSSSSKITSPRKPATLPIPVTPPVSPSVANAPTKQLSQITANAFTALRVE